MLLGIQCACEFERSGCRCGGGDEDTGEGVALVDDFLHEVLDRLNSKVGLAVEHDDDFTAGGLGVRIACCFWFAQLFYHVGCWSEGEGEEFASIADVLELSLIHI